MAKLDFTAPNFGQPETATTPQTETLSFFGATPQDIVHPQVEQVQEDPHQQYKREYEEYLAACLARKQRIAEATAEWREAIEQVHEAQRNVVIKKLRMAELKANPAPRAPIKYV